MLTRTKSGSSPTLFPRIFGSMMCLRIVIRVVSSISSIANRLCPLRKAKIDQGTRTIPTPKTGSIPKIPVIVPMLIAYLGWIIINPAMDRNKVIKKIMNSARIKPAKAREKSRPNSLICSRHSRGKIFKISLR